MEAEVRRPRGVDDQRDVVRMGRLGESGDVADGADVRRVPDEDGPRVGVLVERARHGRRRDAERQPGGRVDLGPDPDGREPGEHQAEQHRAVQRAAHHDLVAVAAERQRDRLVGVRGAADGEPADVGAPQPGRARLGVREHPAGELHGVQAGVERYVARDDVADQVVPLLVAGDRERRRPLLLEPQPRIEQRGVAAQAARVGRHAREPRLEPVDDGAGCGLSGETDLSTLLATMSPHLNDGELRLRAGPPGPNGVEDAVVTVAEPEGLTLVLPRERADELGLPYDFVASWITLRVHSALDAVGLTAAFSAALTREGISANVVAGYFHDHLFVPEERRDDAMRALRLLAGQAGAG